MNVVLKNFAVRTFSLSSFYFAALAFTTTAAYAQADSYPNKPIRIVIGNAVGAVSDTFTRLIAVQLQTRWGQPVIVEARPGGSGAIAAALVAKAPADGYTLAMVISTHSTNPYLLKDPGFDPQKSFIPVTMLGRTPTVLSVHSSAGVTSLRDLVEKSKADPSKFAFGSAGTGGMTHMAGELFNVASGAKLLHVPYKGGAPALNDLLGGQIPLQVSTAGLITPHQGNPRIKSLAVASVNRMASLPGVPTFIELGYPEMVVDEWYALVTPTGTPDAIVTKLNREINDILKQPAIREKMAGMEVGGSTQAEAGAFINSEMTRWSRVISVNNIKAD
jgi:tripartite-type tricarboxylate transporter receptor subunit TctC